MKKILALLLTAAALLSLGACAFVPSLPGTGEGESSAASTPAPDPTPKADAGSDGNAEDAPAAVPSGEPEAEETAPDDEEQTDAPQHPIEAFFPAEWEGRYALEWNERSVDLYCLAAEADSEASSGGWLCSYVLVTDPNYTAPAYVEVGTWEGYPVWKRERSDVPGFSTQEIFDEWVSMMRDTVGITDALAEVLREYSGEPDPETLYGTPEKYVEFGYYTGVFRLICDDWTEESLEQLLDAEYPYGFLSVAGDGTAYFMRGRELLQGTVVMYQDIDTKPEDLPLYRFCFNGVEYEGDMLQTMILMENMSAYSYTVGDTEHDSTTWTFSHDSDDWWTEETFAGDIG